MLEKFGEGCLSMPKGKLHQLRQKQKGILDSRKRACSDVHDDLGYPAAGCLVSTHTTPLSAARNKPTMSLSTWE